MNFIERYTQWFSKFLPSPFTIAVLLSIFTFFIALFFSKPEHLNYLEYSTTILSYWEKGLWQDSLLVFAIQMMLILVLGHSLALTPFFSGLITRNVKHCNTTAKSAFLVSFFTILVAYFNWGLGLVFGAIFARKVAEYAAFNQTKINYPLIGAAGYVGLMVWHGGLSGSALAKVAEPNHLRQLLSSSGVQSDFIDAIPNTIGYNLTVFTGLNLTVFFACLVLIPLVMYFIGNQVKSTVVNIDYIKKNQTTNIKKLIGAEKLDFSPFLSKYFGAVIIGGILLKIFYFDEGGFFAFFTPNNINFMLLGLAITLHNNFNTFLSSIDEAISGASGILIQFPLYFGIMGIMNNTGLINDLSAIFIQYSTETTFPVFTFFSAGLVNFFVPSGGGQWAIQGPIIIEAALALNVPLNKAILALAYGDQLTNMLQPFWALPLLGITGLKAKEILPFTLILFGIGLFIFLGALLIY